MLLKRTRFILSIVFILFLTACSNGTETRDEAIETGGDYSEADMATEEAAESDLDLADGESNPASTENEALIGERVIRTADVAYETLEFVQTTSHIMETVSNHGAYVEYSYESSYTPSGFSNSGNISQDYRRIEYTFRVPVESLDDFLNDLDGEEAYKVSEQIGSEDVTQSYRDTEARINVLSNKESRLNDLLDQAESIEDLLQIEDNLSSTIAERESLQSRLDSYDGLIDFSTVRVTVTERPRISNVRGESLSFWERAREAVANSFYTFYYLIQDIAIWFIYAIPFILIIGVVIFAIFFFRKRTNRKK